MKTLAPRTQIEDYLVEEIIDSYEDKVTYKVEDFKLDKSALLSEYDISKKTIYEKLLSFKHPNIIAIDKIFEKNQHIYTISELSNDIKLKKYLLSNSFSESEVNNIIYSLFNMVIELKSRKLSLDFIVENLVVSRGKNIIVDNQLNIINYSNDEQMIYKLGSLIYFLITKEIYTNTEELKPTQKYSKALCGLINRMLGVDDNEKFRTLEELTSLVKSSVKYDENSCEPVVCAENSSNPFSKILSFISIILVITLGLYVVFSDKRTLKASEIGFMEIVQFHIAGYLDKSEAQFTLGEVYEKGYLVDIDLKESVLWYEKAANNSNESAQLYLGYLYQNGTVVPKNIYKAIYWYEKAAKSGNETAQYNLGHIYYNDLEVPKDSVKSIEWLEKAAAQNYKRSYYILGLLYLNSGGDEIDYKKSFEYFSKGLDANDSYSKMAIAYMYQKGYGVEKNHQKAIELYEESAKSGHKVAQYNLGRIYHYGIGAKRDKQIARHWYQLAYTQGYKEAKKALKELDKKPKIKKKAKVQEVKRYDKPAIIQEYQKPKSISYGRFVDEGEYIEDTKTGLFWQKDGISSGMLNFYQAKEYAKSLRLGGVVGWRVPTAKELETIFPAVEKPFINSLYNIQEYNHGKYRSTSYWTSELDNKTKDYAYLYHWYHDGGKNNCYASRNYVYVRCVHD